jgi:hypothetical protein
MPCRVFARVVLVVFASSLAAATGCGDATGPTAPLTEKQKEKEGKKGPGGPAGPKSK